MPENPVIVLVHGAWHGSWCWEPLVPHLGGLDVRLVDLPSAGENPAGPAGLRADADVLRSVVATVPGPVIVCAHSYAGAVASQALAGLGNLAHIVYLCSFLIGRGESLLGAVGGTPPPWWQVRADGYVDTLDPERVFYQDCAPRQVAEAVARLRPHALTAFREQLTEAAWESVPTTYVVCTRDQAIPPEAQRQMATRASRVRELDTSHSPFLSQPQLLAALLREAARDAVAAG
jgi:pimeloyl-ACP methyl ester carboxylesterase